MFKKIQRRFFASPFSAGRPLLWYLLLWLSLIYIWSISEGLTFIREVNPCIQDGCPQVLRVDSSFSPPMLLAFTALMVLLGVLLCICTSDHQKQSRYWACCIAQGLLVLLISLFPGQQQTYVTVSLYLALTLEALAIFRQARPVTILAIYDCLLFVISLLINLFQEGGAGKLQKQIPPGNSWLTPLFGVSVDYLALVLFAGGYLFMYVQQLRARTQLEESHRELLNSADRIQELTLMMERQRMARELHDTLVQNLAGLIRQLDVAGSLLAHQRIERAREIIGESSAYARCALVEARCAIGDLRVGTLKPQDLGQKVQEEVDRFTLATGIVCQAQLEALSLAPESLCEHILRAVGEGLTNVARHAQAKHAWVRAACSDTTLTIEIGDDGIGISPAETMKAGHYGLMGLRERARLAQGWLEMSSAPGKGTVLLLHLPLATEEAVR